MACVLVVKDVNFVNFVSFVVKYLEYTQVHIFSKNLENWMIPYNLENHKLTKINIHDQFI